jgi:hypothetical protein
MKIASKLTTPDFEEIGREKMIVIVEPVNCLSEVNPIIEAEEKEDWTWDNDILVGDVAYLMFSRPIKTEVDWYSRLLDHYPDVIFDRAA